MNRNLCLTVTVTLAALFCGCRSDTATNHSSLSVNHDAPDNRPPELATDLRQAALDGELETIESLLARGVNVDAPDEQGWTALRGAVFVENLQVVKFLLGKKADPNIRTKDNGTTALHQAASGGNTEIVKALLEAGADPNIKDSFSGMTPLMEAAGLGNVAATRLMIENRADVNVQDKWGETVLDQVLESRESALRHDRREDARNLGRVLKLLEKASVRSERQTDRPPHP